MQQTPFEGCQIKKCLEGIKKPLFFAMSMASVGVGTPKGRRALGHPTTQLLPERRKDTARRRKGGWPEKKTRRVLGIMCRIGSFPLVN